MTRRLLRTERTHVSPPPVRPDGPGGSTAWGRRELHQHEARGEGARERGSGFVVGALAKVAEPVRSPAPKSPLRHLPVRPSHRTPRRATPYEPGRVVELPARPESARLPRGWRAGVKRGVDVAGAVLGLVASVPVLAVLAVLVVLDSPGPVVFAQTRVGRNGRPFRCFKLRTMRADAERLLAADAALRAQYEANAFKVPAHVDRRITPLGRFLRTTSLDELPQFWNVLRGDMSLVGPRPIVTDEIAHYGEQSAVLLAVRPGLTGAWAVGGRSRIGYPERASIELNYVREWSLVRDADILLRTVGVVLQRRGAY